MILEMVVTIICLLLMFIGFSSVIFNLFAKKRADRISYLRGFKKGSGILIYLFAVPLYWIGLTYGGADALSGFFGAVSRIFDLIVLKCDITPLLSLMSANTLYAVAVYTCFVLVWLNAIMFGLSVAGQRLWKWRKNLAFKWSNKERLVILGNSEQNYAIYESDKRRAKLIVDKIVDRDAVSLYMKNIAYTSYNNESDFISKKINLCLKRGSVGHFIINTQSDDRNIEMAKTFVKALDSLGEEVRKRCFGLIKVYVFGDPRYASVYEEITASGYGCISYVNKYQRVAMDFIDKYPFTLFMDERHIDYSTSLVKDGVDINAVMIGFGKTNQQIFLTSVANNQFITSSDKGVALKKVKYHIFDKEHAEDNKNLNHSYYRYKNELDDGKYLELPDYPAEEYYYHLNINDTHFYNEIKSIITRSTKGVNFIIIAFGSDLENIDMAQKLLAKKNEWGVDFTIFVKARRDRNIISLSENNCYVIGDEDSVVYDAEKIICDATFKMAMLRDEIYSIENKAKQDSSVLQDQEMVLKLKQTAYQKWFVKKSQMERDSSLYCCLSLRSKLNMMGLDCCPISDTRVGLTEEEYLDIYAGIDKPDTTYYKTEIDGKKIVNYTLDYKDGRRKNMAEHEHLRWNSFMISKGSIPATIDQILGEKRLEEYTNGKNYSVRRHGNLTTFEGLVKFRQMVAKRDKVDEIKRDVISYDYQILDDAHWLLDKVGYKIVKR